tara:strand:- start:1675 stop:2388 length:714 start_codon:yes stop_codon:yes gene_type:complete
MNITLPKNVNVDEITFSDVKKNDYGGGSLYVSYQGRPLILQTPYMSLPFGVSAYEPTDGSPTKYSLDLSFRDVDENPSVKHLYTMLSSFDGKLLDDSLTNSLQWFKQKYNSKEVMKALFTSQVRYSVDRETGELNTKYKPTFKVKVPYNKDRCIAEVYNEKKERVEYSHLDEVIGKGSKVRVILSCSGVWIAGGKFGVSWRLLHLQTKETGALHQFAFQEDSDEESEEDTVMLGDDM